MRSVWMPAFLAACGGQGPEPSCDELVADFQAETLSVRTCDLPEACGQVLQGTSCGCTQDLVARNDADLTVWTGLLDDVLLGECDAGLDSVCSCPEAYGFDCVDHLCTWDYADSSSGLPDCRADAGDAYQLDDLTVDGDTLTVSLGYGGGCAEHDFVLCWPDGSFMESDPVQARLDVWHDAHGDPCDAWFLEDQVFDLTPLRLAWVEAYGPAPGTIVVRVGELSVDYTF